MLNTNILYVISQSAHINVTNIIKHPSEWKVSAACRRHAWPNWYLLSDARILSEYELSLAAIQISIDVYICIFIFIFTRSANRSRLLSRFQPSISTSRLTGPTNVWFTQVAFQLFLSVACCDGYPQCPNRKCIFAGVPAYDTPSTCIALPTYLHGLLIMGILLHQMEWGGTLLL